MQSLRQWPPNFLMAAKFPDVYTVLKNWVILCLLLILLVRSVNTLLVISVVISTAAPPDTQYHGDHHSNYIAHYVRVPLGCVKVALPTKPLRNTQATLSQLGIFTIVNNNYLQWLVGSIGCILTPSTWKFTIGKVLLYWVAVKTYTRICIAYIHVTGSEKWANFAL